MNKLLYRTSILVVPFCSAFLNASAQPNSTATVNTAITINSDARQLLGITMDARTGMNGNSGPVGYYTSTGALVPGVDAIFSDFPMSTLRYPGNPIVMGFNWKKAVGPLPRPNQNLLGSLGPAQSMDLGFDEFMDVVEAKGVDPANVQIMVAIYDSAVSYTGTAQNPARVPYPWRLAADWVEYCNSPVGANWGGGHDWGQDRADNGHYLPYGIRIWNIGNEPWAPGELGNSAAGALNYVNMVQPIIDSMLLRDPTIRITLPAAGNAVSNWNTRMKLFANAHGGIYGLSPHAFPSEDATSFGVIPLGLNNVNNVLRVLADTAQDNGLSIVVGDYAHGIPTAGGLPTGDPELAQQWKGAHLSAEMVAMMSQIPNLERADVWVYGIAAATWRPIRKNSPGNYTLFPTAALYKILFPLLLDKSVSTTSTSPAGSDGNPYSVRSSAFASNDLSSVNVLAVNRDKINTLTFQLNGLAGYTLNNARLLTASGLTAETIVQSAAVANGSGYFTLPPMSVLLLEHSTGIVKLNAGVMLEGAFDSNTLKMRDDLRTASLIPLNEPYTALSFAAVNSNSESTTSNVLHVTGDNAIVDWVRIELRSSSSSSTIVATRNALVQRDGDVVDMDGLMPVTLHIAPGSYFVAIRHRNHLGAMSFTALSLSGSPTTIDFSNTATATYGTAAQKTIGTRNVLWAGNTQHDVPTPFKLKYVGSNNDRDPILVRIGGSAPTNTITGYFVEDVTLDGQVKYVGGSNDRDPILVNIGGSVPTNILTEQLP